MFFLSWLPPLWQWPDSLPLPSSHRYIRQHLGFTDVSRLRKGVVAYKNWLAENPGKREESRFEGDLFVFDERGDVPMPAPGDPPAKGRRGY